MEVNFDGLSKGLSVVSLVIGIGAAWIALPLDREMKILQQQTIELDNQLKQSEAQQKLSFELYKEVKKVLEKQGRTAQDEEAVKVLVEGLAEDPFRYKLLAVLAVGAKAPDVRTSAYQSSEYFEQQVQLQMSEPTTSKVLQSTPSGDSLGSYDIDIFYCAAQSTQSEPLANKVLTVRGSQENGRWRVRLLPDSVNQQPGYRIAQNEIRYNAPAELEPASILQKRLQQLGIQTQLKETLQQTRWYVSIFICQ